MPRLYTIKGAQSIPHIPFHLGLKPLYLFQRSTQFWGVKLRGALAKELKVYKKKWNKWNSGIIE